MSSRPSSCQGCPLDPLAKGFVPAEGPVDAGLLLVGEAAGAEEASQSRPFIGPSGQKLMSFLRRVGLQREEVRMHNLLSCSPPGNELRGAWYEKDAIRHCRISHLQSTLNEPHRAIAAVGSLAAMNLLKPLLGSSKYLANNWHGTVNKVGDHYVIPTFHPSFLLRGNQKLSGVVMFDLMRAKQVAEGLYHEQKAILRVDPELAWFEQWVERVLKSSVDLPVWLAVDTETVEKLSGKAEDELEGSNTLITRINFACNPDEGITVPWLGPYIDLSRRLLTAPTITKWFHNKRYDLPLLAEAGCRVELPVHDTMHLWKVLQSDLPQGLGFIAPFYSMYPAWKHLNEVNQGEYAAIDAFQTLRIAFGMAKDLQKAGQWDTYMRHVYELDQVVLHPAEDAGLLLDAEELARFKQELSTKAAALEADIRLAVGPDAQPWVGQRKTPAEGYVAREVELDLLVCTDCGAQDVTQKHKCKKPKAAKPPKTKRRRKSRLAQDPADNPGAGDIVLPRELPAPSDTGEELG